MVHAASTVGIPVADLLRRGHANARSHGRALAYKWMTVDLGETNVRVGAGLGISRQSVARGTEAGLLIELEHKVSLQEQTE